MSSHVGKFQSQVSYLYCQEINLSISLSLLLFLQETDILDMIAECEADEQQGRIAGIEGRTKTGPRGPKVRT